MIGDLKSVSKVVHSAKGVLRSNAHRAKLHIRGKKLDGLSFEQRALDVCPAFAH